MPSLRIAALVRLRVPVLARPRSGRALPLRPDLSGD